MTHDDLLPEGHPLKGSNILGTPTMSELPSHSVNVPVAPWLPEGFSFLSGFPTAVRKRRVLVPYQAMADDSGTPGKDGIFVLGGLIGKARWWAGFADLWREALDEAPAIAYFKMNEAVVLKGEFGRFKRAERDAKLRRMCRALNGYPFHAVHVTIDLAEHAEYFKEQAALLAQPRDSRGRRITRFERITANPYWYAYHTFVECVCDFLWRRGEREQFDFFVDEHKSLGDASKDWYSIARLATKRPMRDIMPTIPIPRDDKEFLPLQAADLIAWNQRDWAVAAGEESEFAWVRDLLPNLSLATPSPQFGLGAIVRATLYALGG